MNTPPSWLTRPWPVEQTSAKKRELEVMGLGECTKERISCTLKTIKAMN